MLAKIINSEVVEYPFSEQDFRSWYPNTSFPIDLSEELLATYNVYRVEKSKEPDYDRNSQRITEINPILVGDVWNQQWQVIDLSSDEIETLRQQRATEVRYSRANLLKESDWTQCLDSPVDKVAWAAYRQALRDITLQQGFPFTIEWPIQPN